MTDRWADRNPAREAMVAQQLRGRGIRDERVLKAMGELPRELFIPGWRSELAYEDGALPIPAGQTISQPYVVARMTELLAPREGDRVEKAEVRGLGRHAGPFVDRCHDRTWTRHAATAAQLQLG